MSGEERYDVAVVGAGPVGMYLSLRLAAAGHQVAIIEKEAAPYPLPRAVHFDDEIARAFAAISLNEELAEITQPAPIYEWRNAAGDLLLHFDWSDKGPSGWPLATMFSQPQLEAVLDRRVRADPRIMLSRGRRVTALAQDERGVTLDLDDGSRLGASYVVGCDGARSTVRGLLGIPMTELGFSYDWLVVDTRPEDVSRWAAQNLQVCDPARPTTVVSGGPGRRRFEFMRLPDETVAELEDPRKVWGLLEPWGLSPENAELERAVMYTFAARWAETWREGRVFIAGDAAHQMPPFAGQGMCSGIRDAANLAWKLDLVLRGVCDDELLDSYGTERVAHLQSAIGQSVALGQVICLTDPEAVAERDRTMIEAGADPARVLPPIAPPQLGSGVVHATGGAVAFQPRVTTSAGATGLWDQAVGTGLDVLATVSSEEVSDHDVVAALRAAGARFWRVVEAGQPLGEEDVADTDGVLLPHLREAGHDVVVVRPDGYLFGACDASGATALLRELAEDLKLTSPASA